MNKRLILASSSPRRIELLRGMGVEFEVIPSQVDELHDETIDTARLCEMNAERKATDVAQRTRGSIVLGADTLVILEQCLYGKPCDLQDAKRMLSELAGRKHRVITAVCLIDGERKNVFHDSTVVEFKPLSESEISKYIELVSVLDKAGAYGIQEHGELLVKNTRGSFSNVMGLPVERLVEEFDRWGISHNRRNR